MIAADRNEAMQSMTGEEAECFLLTTEVRQPFVAPS